MMLKTSIFSFKVNPLTIFERIDRRFGAEKINTKTIQVVYDHMGEKKFGYSVGDV